MRFGALTVWLFLLCFAPAQPSGTSEQPSGGFEALLARDVKIAMRDGVTLGGDIYFPAHNGILASGPYPVILERTPYGTGRVAQWAGEYVKHGDAVGDVVMVQNVRGRYSSGGTWRGNAGDPSDGFDTAAWIAAQPWSNGLIGTVGFSYSAATQHAMALANPPARYRNSLERAEFLEPGRIYPFTIEFSPTSLECRRGDRIRLDISSSNFPRFDVNPNTGEPLHANRRWKVAENAVYHDPDPPSHITLAVIPTGSR